MDQKNCRRLGHGLLLLIAIVVLSTSSGCAAFKLASVLAYAWKGETVPAQYEGLQGKRVAVVCLSDSSMYAGQLSQAVEQLLESNVPKIETVPQREVYRWLDENNWNELDFSQIGEGVGADVVVAIELESLRLYDGMTMFHGQADLSIVVYDVSQQDKVLFRTDPFRFSYPNNAPLATTDMPEKQFRRLFINALSRRIATTFYGYDIHEDLAVDKTLIGAGR